MRIHRMSVVVAALALGTQGFADRPDLDAGQQIEIMAYNVENLFDAEHDDGKDDWTYLPKGYPGKAEYCKTLQVPAYRKDCEKSDWSDQSVQLKISQMKAAITANRSGLPDVLALVEVENENVVGMLAQALGYQSFEVSNGPDERGIDVALLYHESTRLKFVGSREHEVRIPTESGRRGTRPVLEVEFATSGENHLFVLVNHWPSQSNPAASRIAAAQTVQKVVDDRLAQNAKNFVIAVGDFNVVDTDQPHPFTTVIQNPKSKNPMVDARELFEASAKVSAAEKSLLPGGTYYYARNSEWSKLDRAFVSPNLADGQGFELDETSFQIRNLPLVCGSKGIPKRYNITATSANTAGYTDHFAIVVKLNLP